MLRLLYSLLFYAVTPLVLLRLFWRSRREPLYRESLPQRFGFCEPIHEPGLVWVHSVSAGETNAAAPLIRQLLDRGRPVLVTTMTPTGRERVRTLFGDRVHHAYAPYDLPGAVLRFLVRARPEKLVIIDTEMWPNLIHHASRLGTRVLLVNARLSEKSARGYRMISPLVRDMLCNLEVVAAQSPSHGDRFLALGLPPDKLAVTGSIKFDVTHPGDLTVRTSQIADKIGPRTVILAASTHSGEEEIVLDAFRDMVDEDLLLVLAPRHPHRTPEVESLCKARGLAVSRHSETLTCEARIRVFLLDTMGELMYFYNVAKVAFVGGSLSPTGGHNPMEPASLGVPIIMGPHLHNIEDIAGQFMEAGAMQIVHNADELKTAISDLLGNETVRAEVIANASGVMDANRGALERVLQLIETDAPSGGRPGR